MHRSKSNLSETAKETHSFKKGQLYFPLQNYRGKTDQIKMHQTGRIDNLLLF